MCDLNDFTAKPEDFAHATKYQALVLKTAIYPRETGVVYCALGLSGEAGEVAGKVKKQIRDGKDWTGEEREEQRQKIVDELGDVLWYAAALAHELGITLADAMARNINKLQDRKRRGVLSGSGDAR